MAYDKIIDSGLLDAAISKTAAAIREKTGSSDLLIWDTDLGFSAYVEDIESDGASAEITLKGILEGTVTSVNDSSLEELRSYAFYYSPVTDLNLNKCVKAGMYASRNCTKLTAVSLPVCTDLGADCFYGCSKLTSVYMPLVTEISSGCFWNCSSLAEFDTNATKLNSECFYNCTNLTRLILRSESVVTLGSLKTFNTGTPFVEGGSGGTVYVPSALISSYETATNWSTFYGYGTMTFAAIEGSEYE